MKGVFIVLLIIVLMAVGGWLTFRHSGDHASIVIETGKIERDTREAVQKGAEKIEEAAERIKENAGGASGTGTSGSSPAIDP